MPYDIRMKDPDWRPEFNDTPKAGKQVDEETGALVVNTVAPKVKKEVEPLPPQVQTFGGGRTEEVNYGRYNNPTTDNTQNRFEPEPDYRTEAEYREDAARRAAEKKRLADEAAANTGTGTTVPATGQDGGAPTGDTTTGDTPTVPMTDEEKETDRVARLNAARATNDSIANDASGYLAQNNLLNEYTAEDIFLRNPDGSTKNDPVTGEPLVRPDLKSADQVVQPRTDIGPASFASASSAQAFLAEFTAGKAVTAEDHADIQAAKDVIVQDYEASLIPLEEVGKSLEKLQDTEPMAAASTAKHMNDLLAGMEAGTVPMWARPAVTKVEQALAGRGISASSIGRDSLFNAIIGAALPIAQADASFEQDANKTNFNAKAQMILSDSSQKFAARQFNATSINQRNQFLSGLQAQVDGQNAARKDNMAQFNSAQRNDISKFNTSQLNEMEKLNTSERNTTARSNAANQTQVAVSNAQMATQVAMANSQAANQMAQHQGTLDAQREEFNTKNANIIAQADVAWRRGLNTAETAGINAANQANVSNAFNLTTQAQQNIWNESRDAAHWAETANENMIARKHEGAMRILLASEASSAAAAQAKEGKVDPWEAAKDKLVQKGIDSAIDWLLGD